MSKNTGDMTDTSKIAYTLIWQFSKLQKERRTKATVFYYAPEKF